MTTLIGITGKAGAGKDTVADYLCVENGYTKYCLAAPIKAAVNAMLTTAQAAPINWNNRAEKEARHPLLGCSPRRAAQTLGTDWGRQMINDSIWLVLANQFINSLQARGYGVVVPDVRFENEASWLRERGGTLIHITRPGSPAVEAHISEAGVEVMVNDIVVTNDGSIATLLSKVRDGLGVTA